MFQKSLLAAAMLVGISFSAQATTVSPTGGALPVGVSVIGGVVFDGVGLNSNRLVTQTAASSLFDGGTRSSITIGSQLGFSPALLSQLGGGFSSVSIRITLFDGDNQTGNFDEDDNLRTVNNLNFGNFSDVATTRTNSTGGFLSSGLGFGNQTLDTGFFTVTDAGILESLFTSLSSTGTAVYGLTKLDNDFQNYDFTQGLDGTLINIGTPPVVTPPTNPTNPTNPIPLPAAGWMLIAGIGGLAAMRRRKARAAPDRFRTMMERPRFGGAFLLRARTEGADQGARASRRITPTIASERPRHHSAITPA